MQFIKQLDYKPIRQFILRFEEKNGVIGAMACERAFVRTMVSSATKRQFRELQDRIENYEQCRPDGKFVLAREVLFKLATIYCRDTENGPVVFDIHFHHDGKRNGHRTEEQVIQDTMTILKNAGYAVDLSVGAFMGNKAGHKKTYVKLKTKQILG